MAVWKKISSSIFCLAYLVLFLLSCTALLKKENVKTEEEKKYEEMRKWTRPADDFDLPFIFIGGMPRSGTTLTRTMLEAHPDIRCGPETHVIPQLLMARKNWLAASSMVLRLQEAGVEPEALDIAIGRFLIEIIRGHAPPATYFCNKDPFVLLDMKYVHHLFPNAKFIYVIRDGRATAHSIVSKGVTIAGIDITNYRSVLKQWNRATTKIHRQCDDLGEKICLPVYYEQLVLQPLKNTKRIFEFLNITWCKEVLHHERHANETELSKFEWSTNQVKKPLYLDALTAWFGSIPPDVERDMDSIAPMLAHLGYDPNDRTPDYGEPDDFVLGRLKL